jgi:branched-chain amino acid transport system ATP-binding protein
MLEVYNIHTYYGESHVLQGVSLRLAAGSLIALLGRNGMGKSTTINTIMGIQPSRSGRIVFKGTDISHENTYKIARMGMAIVPQGRHIFPSLTVKENLILGINHRKSFYTAFNLDNVLDLFPALKLRLNQLGNHLSGGEQEMLCIGRALLGNPDLILMDEPFEGLAPVIVQNLITMLTHLKNQGLSILLVEQNVPAALQMADHVYVMEKGKIVLEGVPGNSEWQAQVQKCILGF